MNLKNAAFLALIGMLLLSVLDAAAFLRNLSGLAQNAVAMMTVLASGIHLLASLLVTFFFWVYFRAQA